MYVFKTLLKMFSFSYFKLFNLYLQTPFKANTMTPNRARGRGRGRASPLTSPVSPDPPKPGSYPRMSTSSSDDSLSALLNVCLIFINLFVMYHVPTQGSCLARLTERNCMQCLGIAKTICHIF